MADELQKHGWDVTRALAESGGLGMVEREQSVNSGGGVNGTAAKFEQIIKFGSSFFHFPSEERLATADAGFSSTEIITSGAQVIGVDNSNFSTLTGNEDLQSVLDEIDSLLASTSGPFLLRDGTTTLTGNWDTGGADRIRELVGLELDDGLSGITLQTPARESFSKMSDDGFYVGGGSSTDFGVLANTGFVTAADWTFGTGWTFDTDHAVFTDASGSGDLEQLQEDRSGAITVGVWFHLKYTTTNGGTPSASTFTIPAATTLNNTAITLDTSDGTHDVYFKPIEGDFKISAAASGAGTVEFDDIKLGMMIGVEDALGDDYFVGGGQKVILFGKDIELSGRGVSSGGTVRVVGKGPIIELFDDDMSDFDSDDAVGSFRVSAQDRDTGGAGSVPTVYDLVVRVGSTNWSSGDANTKFVERSVKDGDVTPTTFREVDEFHNYHKWPNLTDGTLISDEGEHKYAPNFKTIISTAGLATMQTITLANGNHYEVRVKGIGHKSAAAGQDFNIEFRVDLFASGGSITVNSTTFVTNFTEGAATISLTTSGLDILIQALGIAAITVHYMSQVTLFSLDSR